MTIQWFSGGCCKGYCRAAKDCVIVLYPDILERVGCEVLRRYAVVLQRVAVLRRHSRCGKHSCQQQSPEFECLFRNGFFIVSRIINARFPVLLCACGKITASVVLIPF